MFILQFRYKSAISPYKYVHYARTSCTVAFSDLNMTVNDLELRATRQSRVVDNKVILDFRAIYFNKPEKKMAGRIAYSRDSSRGVAICGKCRHILRI